MYPSWRENINYLQELSRKEKFRGVGCGFKTLVILLKYILKSNNNAKVQFFAKVNKMSVKNGDLAKKWCKILEFR